MSLITASTMAMTSVIITTMTMSTSTLIIIIIIVIIIVIASAGGVILPTVALVLSPIIVSLAPSSALGASIVGSCRVCSLYNYLCSFHYDNNYLSLQERRYTNLSHLGLSGLHHHLVLYLHPQVKYLHLVCPPQFGYHLVVYHYYLI